MGVFVRAQKGDKEAWVGGNELVFDKLFACDFFVDLSAEKAIAMMKKSRPDWEFTVVECDMDDPNHPWR